MEIGEEKNQDPNGFDSKCSNDSSNDLKEKAKPNLRVHISNVIEGSKPVLEVYTDESIEYDVLVASCPDFANVLKAYEVQLHNGYGEAVLYEENNLPPGNYTVTVSFYGNSKFDPEQASTTFTVKPNNLMDPNLSIKVDDIDYGKNAYFDISANKFLNGKVFVKLNNSCKSYLVQMKNGHGQLTIDDLDVGNYTADVVFDGNNIFKFSKNSTRFEVKGWDLHMDVDAEDVTADESPIIHVRTDTNDLIKVKIQIYVNSTICTSHEVDVCGEEFIKLHEKFTPGEYDVKAVFEGNGKYAPCENTTQFNVTDDV